MIEKIFTDQNYPVSPLDDIKKTKSAEGFYMKYTAFY